MEKKLIDNKWHKRWFSLMHLVEDWSKDTNTKVGCVIVGPYNELRSIGYNGFPRGVHDKVVSRYERPDKYLFTEHAERNALYNASLSGSSVKDCVLYIGWCPCADCARAIIQSGISAVIVEDPYFMPAHWAESCSAAVQMFLEAEVEVPNVKEVKYRIDKVVLESTNK